MQNFNHYCDLNMNPVLKVKHWTHDAPWRYVQRPDLGREVDHEGTDLIYWWSHGWVHSYWVIQNCGLDGIGNISALVLE